jgi:hypothetical protein
MDRPDVVKKKKNWGCPKYMMSQWLIHRCLYYKHGEAILGDTQFDNFEERVFDLIGEQDMVDWDKDFNEKSALIDTLPLRDVLELAEYQ